MVDQHQRSHIFSRLQILATQDHLRHLELEESKLLRMVKLELAHLNHQRRMVLVLQDQMRQKAK